MASKMKNPAVIVWLVVILAVSFLSGCEQREFQKAKQANTVEAYNAFLGKYPNSKLASEANAAIEGLEWEKATTADTIAAYQGYMTKYPTGKFASEATVKIAELEKKAMIAKEEEALTNLAAIRDALEAYKAKQEAKQAKVKVKKNLYVECKPSPPNGGADATPDEWSDAGGFTTIEFQPSGPVLYQYAVKINKTGTAYTATATGDLDEDGIQVTFTVTNESPDPVKSSEDEY
jgi:hypothetical protein